MNSPAVYAGPGDLLNSAQLQALRQAWAEALHDPKCQSWFDRKGRLKHSDRKHLLSCAWALLGNGSKRGPRSTEEQRFFRYAGEYIQACPEVFRRASAASPPAVRSQEQRSGGAPHAAPAGTGDNFLKRQSLLTEADLPELLKSVGIHRNHTRRKAHAVDILAEAGLIDAEKTNAAPVLNEDEKRALLAAAARKLDGARAGEGNGRLA